MRSRRVVICLDSVDALDVGDEYVLPDGRHVIVLSLTRLADGSGFARVEFVDVN
jgi:hypothetical protein